MSSAAPVMEAIDEVPVIQSDVVNSKKPSNKSQPKNASKLPKKKAKKEKKDVRPFPIKSTAMFHGFDTFEIEEILDVILEEESNKEQSSPINWKLIADRVNSSNRKKDGYVKVTPETIQRIWKYVAYGQLFAGSSDEIRKARSGQSCIRNMLVGRVARGIPEVPCQALPSSDEEDFLYCPRDYAIGKVDHKVAVLTRKEGAAIDVHEMEKELGLSGLEGSTQAISKSTKVVTLSMSLSPGSNALELCVQSMLTTSKPSAGNITDDGPGLTPLPASEMNPAGSFDPSKKSENSNMDP